MSVILPKKHFGLGFNLLIKGSFILKDTLVLFLFFFCFFVFDRPRLNREYLFLQHTCLKCLSYECHYAFAKTQGDEFLRLC